MCKRKVWLKFQDEMSEILLSYPGGVGMQIAYKKRVWSLIPKTGTDFN